MTIDLSDEEIALLFFALGIAAGAVDRFGMRETAGEILAIARKFDPNREIPKERVCSACGISLSWAHERSMGLYCHATANGMHQFGEYPPKDTSPE